MLQNGRCSNNFTIPDSILKCFNIAASFSLCYRHYRRDKKETQEGKRSLMRNKMFNEARSFGIERCIVKRIFLYSIDDRIDCHSLS